MEASCAVNRDKLNRIQELPFTHAGRSPVLHPHVPEAYSLQVVQGRLFGMRQSKANQWIHVLLPALLAALHTLGDAPARSLTALAQRLGVSEADAATVVTPLEAEAATTGARPAAASGSPLLPMTAPSDASSAPRTLLNRKRVIAARKKTIR